MKVALACGGTGGHIFPGLATAEVLRERGHEVTLWLAGKDVEQTAVQNWPGPVITVKSEGFPTAPSARILGAALRISGAIRACGALMRKEKPDVVLAMGSYASVGPVMAALRLGIPCVLHESNAVPGRATSLLARWAHAVAISFDETRAHLRRRRNLVYTGMPLRKHLAAAAARRPADAGRVPFHVLLMGGSRGAHFINECGARAIRMAKERGSDLQVTHLAGAQDADTVRAMYAAAGVRNTVAPFAHDMASIYRSCDFAVCRAGAATCAELIAFGLPALLVPYPSAVRDHQSANARAMERMGAAQAIAEKELTADWLAGYIADAIAHPERLSRMREAARSHATLNSAEAVADLVEKSAGAGRVA
jgi:UDP-N-acetylglucosamine--N-acetylmuramyl-(pentapeptide) pyrophosphoryl-undecaprenol N-acetylglucosamine transferase